MTSRLSFYIVGGWMVKRNQECTACVLFAVGMLMKIVPDVDDSGAIVYFIS